jgi:ParB/RepB/Spo0J family partition protein
MSSSESQTTSSSVSQIPLSEIRISPFNYRRTVHGIAELAKSIAADGVQQPIKIRPIPPDEAGRSYEIVFGERRYRAASEAGLASIPAFIEDLPDNEVQRLQVLENSQRADVHPLEEAEGWERLLKLAGPSGPLYTVESLAQLVGRSAQHVYGRAT